MVETNRFIRGFNKKKKKTNNFYQMIIMMRAYAF